MSRPDHNEGGSGRPGFSAGVVPCVSTELEPTSGPLNDLCVECVGAVEPERRLVVDGEAARDGERSDRIEDESEEVVEGEGDGAAVRDSWGTDLGVGESVDRLDTRGGPHHAQPETGRVVWPTPSALRGVRWQPLAELHRVLTGQVRRPPGDHFPIVLGVPFTGALVCAMVAGVVNSRHAYHFSAPSYPGLRLERDFLDFDHGQVAVGVHGAQALPAELAEVFGTSEMKHQRSGSHHVATSPLRKLRN